MNELALFAGAGGGILGGKLLGWRTVCAVEIDTYARRVLLARQRDGSLGPFPIWDDVRTFDGRPWRGHVGIVTAGFPCQGISTSNQGGQGLDDERSGLFFEAARIIGEVRPDYVFLENSPNILNRGIGRVLGSLAAMGYVGCHGVLGGESAGLDFKGERMWFVAKAPGIGWESLLGCLDGQHQAQGVPSPPAVDADTPGPLERIRAHEQRCGQRALLGEPDGSSHRVDRLRVIGNMQSPLMVPLAIRSILGCLTQN